MPIRSLIKFQLNLGLGTLFYWICRAIQKKIDKKERCKETDAEESLITTSDYIKSKVKWIWFENEIIRRNNLMSEKLIKKKTKIFRNLGKVKNYF